MPTPLRLFPSVLCLVLFAAGRAWTQPAADGPEPGIRIALRGVILDATRAPIAGARITASPDAGAGEPSAVSDASGAFVLVLAAGQYTLVATAPGFAPDTRLVVATRTVEPVEFVLSIAALQETVTVTAAHVPSAYQAAAISTSTKTATPLLDVPQSVTVVTRQLIQDQLMLSVADVVRYVPGVTAHQGENNRDQVVIRGNNSSADFFLDGVRDDVQYYRDLYTVERVEALKGPNAMIFGRGGGGGVINRVSKVADFVGTREVTLLDGAFGDRRVAADVDQPLSDAVAVRLNAMYENAGSFRQGVDLERYGVSPSLTFVPDARTRVTVSYEHFRDDRVADRGVPSYHGRPADADISTYFGNSDDSRVNARADVASTSVERQFGAVNLRNRTLVGGYARSYQNFVPGVVNEAKTTVSLSAYNNDTRRLNLFNQTDLTTEATTGSARHTLLAGVEIGRQLTDNFRNTGYFDNASTAILVPYANPTVATPVSWRQSATDADNHLVTSVMAVYAQDQIELSRFVQVLGGVRFDSFDLAYHNNRTGADLGRADRLVSPRAGVIVKPIEPLSLYGNYTVSYLPSSGDQFSSLTTVTEQVKPEKFTNYEAGAKWDLARALSLTAAAYRLDRTNTRATDPLDPTRIVQTGSQRTNGVEVGAAGHVTSAWQIAGGYAYQHAFVTSATTSAAAGAQVAQVPRHTLSLWNTYQLNTRLGAGFGVVRRTDMFAAIDNTVTLPGYTDADAAVYLSLTRQLRLQVNVENVFNRTFYVNADNNTNISPGSPRAARVALVTRF